MSDAAVPFRLPPEIEEYRSLARKIVREEMLPLEQRYLASPLKAHSLRARDALRAIYPPEVVQRLYDISQKTGLWGLNIPEEFGGSGLPLLAKAVIQEEFYYCAVPFPFAEVPNILYHCKGEQIERYLKPCIDGTKIAAFAQTEPNAGSDPGGMMTTRAVRDGDDWVIDGTKMWISNAVAADFVMVQAVTDPQKRQRGGITMFLVDRNNPGMKVVEAGLPTWLDERPSQFVVNFDNCRVPQSAVLGEVGQGFVMGQKWLTIMDRLLRGPFCLGKMQRGLDMSIEWAKQRHTFGKPLAERQAIQWKIVDMYVAIRAVRNLIYEVAARADAGEDVRTEAAMIKLTAAEWGSKVLDDAIQIHGAMGEALELPLSLFYRYVRHARIGGGADEIQRMMIARMLLQ
ncbi:MAG TPA: acyl-CoA dehydrogenase family protein [Burkholderiaceae bacterium]|nr:acyl-CoA dehydrogenase family protein [Burkholderiaceae bacterium]